MKCPLFLLVLSCCTTSFSQEGFETIRKAEKKIDQGKYKRALQLLDQADTMNYGFCGLAWIEAREIIVLDRIRIYDSLKEPLKAAEMLNNCEGLYSRDVDSLKTVYYIKAFGKETVLKELDAAINAIQTVEGVSWVNCYEIPVSFSQSPFRISSDTMAHVIQETKQETEVNKEWTPINRFKAALRNQDFYALLQN